MLGRSAGNIISDSSERDGAIVDILFRDIGQPETREHLRVAGGDGIEMRFGLGDGQPLVAGREVDEAESWVGVSDIDDGDVEGGSLTRNQLALGGLDVGDHDIGATEDDKRHLLEVGFVILCPDSKLVIADGEVGWELQISIAVLVGIGSSNEGVGFGVDQSDIGIGHSDDRIV